MIRRTIRVAIAALAVGAAATACRESADPRPGEGRQPISERPATGASDRSGLAYEHLDGGRAHAAAGRTAEAVAELERARQLAPDDPVVLSALGQALLDSGRTSAARDALERAVALAGNDDALLATLYFYLGKVREADGQFDRAREDYERSLRSAPARADTTEALRQIATRPDQVCTGLDEREALCRCLAQVVRAGSIADTDTGLFRPTCTDEGPTRAGVALWRVSTGPTAEGSESALIAVKSSERPHALALLASDYRNQRIHQMTRVQEARIVGDGPNRAVRFEVTRSDSYRHGGVESMTTTREALYCPLPASQCTVHVVLDYRADTEECDPTGGECQTTVDSWRVEDDAEGDSVLVTPASGRPPSSLVGRHALRPGSSATGGSGPPAL